MTDSADDGDTDVNVVSSAVKSPMPAHLIDECSNDSTASRFSTVSEQLNPVSNLDSASLDKYLREPDPDLATGDNSACTSPIPADSSGADKKKSKRRSSEKRHHKHHRRSNKDTMFPMDDPMDRLVACNVDEVLVPLMSKLFFFVSDKLSWCSSLASLFTRSNICRHVKKELLSRISSI